MCIENPAKHQGHSRYQQILASLPFPAPSTPVPPQPSSLGEAWQPTAALSHKAGEHRRWVRPAITEHTCECQGCHWAADCSNKRTHPALEDWTWDALGIAGWLISSVPAIRSLWNHIRYKSQDHFQSQLLLNPDFPGNSWQASFTSQAAEASYISAHSMSTDSQMNQLVEFCQTAWERQLRTWAKSFHKSVQSP